MENEAEHILDITIYGQPVPLDRPRNVPGKKKPMTTPRVRNAKHDIGLLAKQVMKGRHPCNGEITVYAGFYCKNRRWGDLDNYLKLALDALNGIVYRDDVQIVNIVAKKRVDADQPRIVLSIWHQDSL